jgi:hypothetical protein
MAYVKSVSFAFVEREGEPQEYNAVYTMVDANDEVHTRVFEFVDTSTFNVTFKMAVALNEVDGGNWTVELN